MKRGPLIACVILAILLTAGIVNYLRPYSPAKEIRWLIAHEPVHLFERAAAEFETEYNRVSDGPDIRLVLLGPSDIGGEGAFSVDKDAVMQALSDGVADIATFPIAAFGTSTAAVALSMPFLAQDDESLASILESEPMTQLMERVSAPGMHPLAFTLSGGLQLFISDTLQMRTARDLRGKRVATANGAIAADVIRAIGATPVMVERDGTQSLFDAISSGQADAAETTYTRLSIYPVSSPIILNEINHSVFFTLTFSSSRFYDGLTSSEREALRSASLEAARAEREDSISLAIETRDRLVREGSTSIVMDAVERDILRRMSESIDRAYVKESERPLLQALREMGN